MHGSLDPEENVMQDELISKRKAIAVCNQGVVEQLYDVIAKLGWDCYDDVSVELVELLSMRLMVLEPSGHL